MFKKELDQEEQSFLKALDNDFDNITLYMAIENCYRALGNREIVGESAQVRVRIFNVLKNPKILCQKYEEN